MPLRTPCAEGNAILELFAGFYFVPGQLMAAIEMAGFARAEFRPGQRKVGVLTSAYAADGLQVVLRLPASSELGE